MRPPQPPDNLEDMPFPLHGIDVAHEFEQQPPGTTPLALNVRTYEALTQRGRGGSRPGLSQYIPAQVNGANLIQHLNVLVDPQAAALPDWDPPTGITGGPAGPSDIGYFDPTEQVPNATELAQGLPARNALGRLVRTGGTGIQPTLNQSKLIKFIQANTGFTAGAPGTLTFTLAYNAPVHTSNLLVLCAGLASLSTDSILSFSDSASNGWNMAIDSAPIGFVTGGAHYGGIWYAVAGTTGPVTLTIQGTDCYDMWATILEYKGTRTSGVLDGTVANIVTGTQANPMTTGTVPVTGVGELVIALFVQGFASYPTSPAGGAKARSMGVSNDVLFVEDFIGAVHPGALTATAADGGLGINGPIGLGASFKSL